MEYKQKLENLMTLTKPYALRDSFMLLKDADGWTDGYIADLTGMNTEAMKAKAGKMTSRDIRTIDKTPEIKPLIPDGSHAVENVALDLSDNMAILYNRTVSVKVNPSYLKYFYSAYKQIGGISDLILTAPDKPVKVMAMGELVGMVMPVKTHANR
ncbi:hypothetical protein HZB78_05545 [Candidatus Collierbacteria bacterium]|nr:hypothetical protein [Candidatus Collierbacteria bacterium]